jgi:hypothetical protein
MKRRLISPITSHRQPLTTFRPQAQVFEMRLQFNNDKSPPPSPRRTARLTFGLVSRSLERVANAPAQ